jgi:hypothetical protein
MYEYSGARHPDNGKARPFVYKPGFGLSDAMKFRTSKSELKIKKKTWSCSTDDAFAVGVDRHCVLGCSGGCCHGCYQYYCWFKFSKAFSHEEHITFKYAPTDGGTQPGFEMPPSYKEFWKQLREFIKKDPEKCDLINTDAAEKHFANEFLKFRPMTFEDTLTQHYNIEFPTGGSGASTQIGGITCTGPAKKCQNDSASSTTRSERDARTDLDKKRGNQALQTKSNGLYMDIYEGMRLRVEFAAWQEPPGQAPRACGDNENVGHNEVGYVGTGTSYLYVDRVRVGPVKLPGKSDRSGSAAAEDPLEGTHLSFDPFVGFMRSRSSILNLSEPSPRKGTGAVDLSLRDHTSRHFRIGYPKDFFQSYCPHNAQPWQSIVLIGANLRSELTKEKCDVAVVKGWCNACPNEPLVTSFRGRTVVVPEVRIQIGQERPFIAIGSTFRNEVRRLEDWPSSRKRLTHHLYRMFEGRLTRVEFAGLHEWVFDIPLLRGDVIK